MKRGRDKLARKKSTMRKLLNAAYFERYARFDDMIAADQYGIRNRLHEFSTRVIKFGYYQQKIRAAMNWGIS